MKISKMLRLKVMIWTTLNGKRARWSLKSS